MQKKHHNQPDGQRETKSNKCDWWGEEGHMNNNTAITGDGDDAYSIYMFCMNNN